MIGLFQKQVVQPVNLRRRQFIKDPLEDRDQHLTERLEFFNGFPDIDHFKVSFADGKCRMKQPAWVVLLPGSRQPLQDLVVLGSCHGRRFNMDQDSARRNSGGYGAAMNQRLIICITGPGRGHQLGFETLHVEFEVQGPDLPFAVELKDGG